MNKSQQLFQKAINTLTAANKADSFFNIIMSDREAFCGLKVIYASATSAEFNGVSFDAINEECRLIRPLFTGRGLQFYTDEVFSETIRGQARIPLDYSLSFDSNIAEQFRLFVSGKKLSDSDSFLQLVKMVKVREPTFNFDFMPFILENLAHDVDGNDRPLNTLTALKQFDYLGRGAYATQKRPDFAKGEVRARIEARMLLDSCKSDMAMQHQLARQKTTYLMLLHAMILRWKYPSKHHDNIARMVRTSLNFLGKFAKTEIYFASKLLAPDKRIPHFFSPVSSPRANGLVALRGISWDLFFLRFLETASTKDDRGTFYVPFMASSDKKYASLVEVFPVKAIVSSPQQKLVHTVYADDMEFMTLLANALPHDLREELESPTKKASRLSSTGPTTCELNQRIAEAEKEVQEIFPQKT
jgi:hypothetical protein